MQRDGVTALLGPTNTGKTFIAMQRMMACDSGIIGFPLRLLARENYDKVVREKGVNAVALITGEEKIIPKQARYFICTVEAMPLDMNADFVAVDEIQLCGDPERGHIFTDRLLHSRGRLETVFLGSETIRNLLVQLIPDIEIETRPRFSKLTYVQTKKIGRIPRRSALVVFSAAEVYRVAEELRQHRGGCAVVLGALSPRTRNAQVELYQAGEVDYMVATDAIGMGLNMDLDHVTFARTRKFDGRQARNLSLSEIAQIAGRAGRHMNDGTFTTTTDIGGFDELTVEAIENHRFDPLRALQWRSRSLDFSHTGALLRSLDQKPPHETLVKTREAEDLVALKQLLANDEIRMMARGPAAVRTLWDVAGVPDFRKTMTDLHVNMLVNVYKFLMKATGRIPEDFVDSQVSRLDDIKGDIDTLINRIANIRTWTFISHRANWMTNAKYWQSKSKKIDDRLSDALHDRLTQRFVDRRAAILVRGLVNGEKLSGKVEKDGSVVIEGQNVGTFRGFTFTPDPSIMDAHAKPILTAARKVLVEEVDQRLAMLVGDNDGAFRLLEDGHILWREVPMARLAKGSGILEPSVSVIASDLLEPQARDRIQDRLRVWLKAHLNNRLAPYFQLQSADLTGSPRGVAYQLIESLGLLRREDVADMVKGLTKEERKALYDQNVRIGRHAIWVKGLTNPTHWPWRALLWGLWQGVKDVRDFLPSTETKVVEMPAGGWGAVRADFYAMLGFVPLELYNPRGRPHLVYARVDALDNVSNAVWSASNAGAFVLPEGLAERLSCSEAMMKRIVSSLGFKRANERDIERANDRIRHRAERDAANNQKRELQRAAKEAARKAELLAREVVAAEGMELSAEQILAVADAEAKAAKMLSGGQADKPADSNPSDLSAPAQQADLGSDHRSSSVDDLADRIGETAVKVPEPTLDQGESAEKNVVPQDDSDNQNELWVRVFRKPGQGVPEGEARSVKSGDGQRRSPRRPQRQASNDDEGRSRPNSGDKKEKGHRRQKHADRRSTQSGRGAKSANWSVSVAESENNPFAALAALKDKK